MKNTLSVLNDKYDRLANEPERYKVQTPRPLVRKISTPSITPDISLDNKILKRATNKSRDEILIPYNKSPDQMSGSFFE